MKTKSAKGMICFDFCYILDARALAYAIRHALCKGVWAPIPPTEVQHTHTVASALQCCQMQHFITTSCKKN